MRLRLVLHAAAVVLRLHGLVRPALRLAALAQLVSARDAARARLFGQAQRGQAPVLVCEAANLLPLVPVAQAQRL